MLFTTENRPQTKSPQDGKPERRDPARLTLATMLFTAATGYQQELAGCPTRDKTLVKGDLSLETINSF